MSQETVIYLVNLLIGMILAGVLSQYWRIEASGQSLRPWIVAAWTLAIADLFFVARSMLPSDTLSRLVPTITVTCGHAILLLAALNTAGRSMQKRVVGLIVSAHLLILLIMRAIPAIQDWRAATNSVVWGSLSLVSAMVLWRASDQLRPLMRFPALVLGFQAVFHATRSLLATQAAVDQNALRSSVVQLLGDLEVSLFMVALFVGVLVAYLRQSNADLRAALDNVRQLSSMLPLCAWCNKVRDDDGYWRRIEEYLSEHKVSVTHSMCESCASKHFDDYGADRQVGT